MTIVHFFSNATSTFSQLNASLQSSLYNQRIVAEKKAKLLTYFRKRHPIHLSLSSIQAEVWISTNEK